MKKLKLNQQVKYNGQQCLVFSIKDSEEVVLFNLETREYLTVKSANIER